MGLTKPQLGLLIYPGLLIAEYRDYGVRGAWRLLYQTAICTALLTIPLFIAYPVWPKDLVSLLFGYAGSPWNTPTLYAQLPGMFGAVGKVLWALAFLVAAVVSWRAWWQGNAKTALVWSLARESKKSLLYFGLPIACALTVTHAMVPPHPAPAPTAHAPPPPPPAG